MFLDTLDFDQSLMNIYLKRLALSKKGKIKLVRVVDVHVHSRLRPKLDEYLPQAAGLIFVVDALDFVPNFHAAAEYLYEILTNAPIMKKRIRLLIMCNKSDKVNAHTKKFIRKQCEHQGMPYSLLICLLICIWCG
ncbi:hypothetical protein MKW92_015192 [Papaver armeniacum]|nr:hypothetical protein MKW92_015192 [Papaver armeniacum]